MDNATSRQRELLDRLAAVDPSVVVRWDEGRGVAASVRGTLERPTRRGAPAATVDRFLAVFGPLFGPPDLARRLRPLRGPRQDDIGWTHLDFQQYASAGSKPGPRAAALEVYGGRLAAHVRPDGVLAEVQSGCWRDVEVPGRPRLTAAALRRQLAAQAAAAPDYAELARRMKRRRERRFPLMQAPRLVIHVWRDRFRLAWTTYAYVAVPGSPDPGAPRGLALVLGQVFVDAVTREQFLFSPAGMRAEIPVPGTGRGVTKDAAGAFVLRPLNVVRVDNTTTHRLRDATHARDIITYDLAADVAVRLPQDMADAVMQAPPSLAVSETAGGPDWATVAGPGVLRRDSQQPEVDAHFFVRDAYEWYEAVSGGRKGWDDDQYPVTVPASLPVRVATHVHPQLRVGAGFDWGLVNGQWIPFMMFWDGDPAQQCGAPGDRAVDYLAGSRNVVGHEYQHGITAFSFIDGAGNPGLGYWGWTAAVHEGLSDVFGCLFSDLWTWGPEVSSAGLVVRNAAFPRDPTSWENRPGPLPCGFGHQNRDHFADRVASPTGDGEQYDHGSILAHAAYLMAAGGIHQRAARTPVHIPVRAVGRETLGGRPVSRAARIWYRALTYYLSARVAAVTDRADLDEQMFRDIREGCVEAAGHVYGAGSVEQKTTALAFSAVGLHPTDAPYGADVTCVPWAAAWWRSRPYLGGLYAGAPDWASIDLFVNNGGASEWNALVNVLDGAGRPTHFENTVYCRVRNIGDLPAQNVLVEFFYAKLGPAPVAWLPVLDRNGVAQTLVIPSLGAGRASFPETSQASPPAAAGVKWDIPPLHPGESVDHFCLKARLTCAGNADPAADDVDAFDNEVQSNIAYVAYTPARLRGVGFLVGNPRARAVRAELVLTAELPAGWRVGLDDEWAGSLELPPKAERAARMTLEMPAGADAALEPPLDGVVTGRLYGPLAGECRGALTGTRWTGERLTGRLALELGAVGHVAGLFEGALDPATGAIEGRALVSAQNAVTGDARREGVGFTGRLRPWRRVHVTQVVDGEAVGGFTIQIQGALPGGLDAPALPGTRTTAHPEKGDPMTPTDPVPTIPAGDRAAVVRQDLDNVLHPVVPHRQLEAEPLVVVKAHGSTVVDADGTEYLDAMAGLWCVNVGYGRDELAEVAARQMRSLPYYPHTAMNAPAAALAERVNGLLGGDNHVYFVASGSEANEAGFKIARQYMKHEHPGQTRYKTISRYLGYHGTTLATLAAGGMGDRKTKFEPLGGNDFVHVAAPYCYRCPFGLTYPSCELACVKNIEATIQGEGPDTVATLLVEPVMSAVGVAVPPDEYLPAVAALAKRYGCLLHVDEVINGFGRTGAMFAHQHYGVEPDIVAIAKGLVSAYLPIAATVVKDRVFASFVGEPAENRQVFQISTYGGHPVAAAVALANVDIIEREGLVGRAAEHGAYLLDGLRTLGRHPWVGDVRGKGLLAGVELVKDRRTKEIVPADRIKGVVDFARQRGVLVGRSGGGRHLGNTIVLSPPLIVTRAEIDRIVRVLDEAIVALGQALEAA